MSAALPAFARATRLAKTLFGALDAAIILVGPDGVWRSRDSDELPADDPAAELILKTGQPLWIENALADSRFADLPVVRHAPFLRFYVGVPVRLADGRTLGVICVVDNKPHAYDKVLAARLCDLAGLVADECDRAKAEEEAAANQGELERTRALLSAYVETAPVSVVMTDHDMQVLKASPTWLAAFGLTEDAAYGRTLYDIGPNQFPQFREHYEACLRGVAVRGDRVRWEHHGRTRWLQATVTPWHDCEGAIGGVLIASHDVTDIVEAKDRIERSEERLKLALDMARMHVFELDFQEGAVEKAGVENLFYEASRSFQELKDDPLAVVDPRDRERVRQALHRHLRDGEDYQCEYRVNRSDGQEIWAASISRSVRDKNGKILREIAAMQDISERKRAEKALVDAKEDAEAANVAKSAFLATISHEIRTPLNGVLGMAQAMTNDEMSPIQAERLGIIRHSGESLLAILNDVLDLSKIEAGKLELEAVEFDVAELCEGAHAAFSAVAEKKGLAFDLKVEKAAKGIYLGDSTRVRQVLFNLVSNALKFTDDGHVRVRVDRRAEMLILTVSDSGIGIAPERLDYLFEKFEQADASTNRRFGGTGLGLSICRELATLMGGSIVADSRPGCGATFTLTLPLERVSTAARKSQTADIEGTGLPVAESSLKVLAAEDNSVNQMVLRTLLQQVGLSPVIVENGAHAVVAWEREPWDLILMDVQMPEVDGPTATKIIRERELNQGRARTPIIALTANAMAHQVEEYRRVGMDAFVAKPIEVSALFAAMQQVLNAAPDAEAA